MLNTALFQLTSSDSTSTSVPLIPMLLAGLGTLSTVLYLWERHRIQIDASHRTVEKHAPLELPQSRSMPDVVFLGVASTWSLSGPWL